MTNKPKPIFQKERVLVVDDIPKWIKVAKNNLAHYGCPLENITVAGDTKTAFEKYSEQEPTLAIIDINFDINNLRDTQGFNLIKKLRKDGYKYPIAVMSSRPGATKRRSEYVGADYFIDKQDFVGGFDNFVKWYTERELK